MGPLTALLPSCPSRWLKLPPLLSSSSVTLRILAGETIALLFELAQDMEVRWDAVVVGGSRWVGRRQRGRSCWVPVSCPCPGHRGMLQGGVMSRCLGRGLDPVIP